MVRDALCQCHGVPHLAASFSWQVSNCTFTVNVTRSPLPPVLNVTSFTVPELSANGTLVGNVAAFDPNYAALAPLTFVSCCCLSSLLARAD